MFDRTAQLKLSPLGLWTKKLGFVPWKQIEKVEIIEEREKENQQLDLWIWIINITQTKLSKPDEILDLLELKNGQYADMIILNFLKDSNNIDT